jgi:hypothetical protein
MAITVVVIVEGGIVQQVECTDKDVIVQVVDLDDNAEEQVVESVFTPEGGTDVDNFVADVVNRYLA